MLADSDALGLREILADLEAEGLAEILALVEPPAASSTSTNILSPYIVMRLQSQYQCLLRLLA